MKKFKSLMEDLKMKKTLIITIVITLIFAIGLLSIPKHEVPTDEEWDTWIEYLEERFPQTNQPIQEDLEWKEFLKYEE